MFFWNSQKIVSYDNMNLGVMITAMQATLFLPISVNDSDNLLLFYLCQSFFTNNVIFAL
jgi:hypothetical protein